MLYNNSNIKWLHKPSAIQSDDKLLLMWLSTSAPCLSPPASSWCWGSQPWWNPDTLIQALGVRRIRASLITPNYCQFAFILDLESIVQLSRWRSLQINLLLPLCDGSSHCQQTPNHSQEHIYKLKFICTSWFLSCFWPLWYHGHIVAKHLKNILV